MIFIIFTVKKKSKHTRSKLDIVILSVAIEKKNALSNHALSRKKKEITNYALAIH